MCFVPANDVQSLMVRVKVKVPWNTHMNRVNAVLNGGVY